ncbi:MAG: choice-of-anchor D domain-containing protein [Rhodoferax sp.]|nr:choice-of-anchor D domain-containing protein [Rhodoferax sp.]
MEKKSVFNRIVVAVAVLANIFLLAFVPQIKAVLAQSGYSNYGYSYGYDYNYGYNYGYGYGYGSDYQSISPIFINPNHLTVGATVYASAVATSGLVVRFFSGTPAVCGVTGNVVTGLKTGACNIIAAQPGNAVYAPASPVTLALTVTVAAPAVTLSPQSLTFGEQGLDTISPSQNIVLTNSGPAMLTIFSITSSSQVFVLTNPCGAVLSARSACNLGVGYLPNGSGNRTGKISVISNAIGSPHTVMLSVEDSNYVAELNLQPGWNLVGNSVHTPFTVASVFSDTDRVNTVWKWSASNSKWAFYTPSLADGGAEYAATKGYEALTTIEPGDGFWVNSRAAFSTLLPAGSVLLSSEFQDQVDIKGSRLSPGWNLVATGDVVTPSVFNRNLSTIPPTPSVTDVNLTTLWAWDNPASAWYFYAPSLEASGSLMNYIRDKGYLDFYTNRKTLEVGTGFWVNKP